MSQTSEALQAQPWAWPVIIPDDVRTAREIRTQLDMHAQRVKMFGNLPPENWRPCTEQSAKPGVLYSHA